MTRREQQALRFVERYTAEHDGVAPTLQEIAYDIGLKSKSNASRIIGRLEAQGRVRWRRGVPRSLEIVGLPAALIATSDEALLAECARRGLLARAT